MFKKAVVAIAASACFASLAVGQSATVSFTSPQNGQSVAPGTVIQWSLSVSVSTGNNQGLALFVADIVQPIGNPGFLNIPRANGIPAAMTNFARPGGISNPAEGGLDGYIGVQRGQAGQKDLVQVGGGQNTFGVARPPGTGVAENANVVAGVGQSGPQLIANGQFNAPSAPGLYTYNLANPVANVLQQQNNPPAFSPVVEATVILAGNAITFTVGGGCPCAGDFNNDNSVGLGDLTLFLASFGGPPSNPCMDTNGDNLIGLPDLTAFLSRFGYLPVVGAM